MSSLRPTSITTVLLSLVLLLSSSSWLVSVVDAHYTHASRRVFTVTPRTPGDKTAVAQVMLTTPAGGRHRCLFRYQTSPAYSPLLPPPLAGGDSATRTAPVAAAVAEPAEKKTVVAKAAPISFDELLQKLKGQCPQHKFGYWQFEVCIGAAVRHFNQDESYLLGNQVSSAAHGGGGQAMQEYGGGAICGGRDDKAPRKARVKFACVKTPIPGGLQSALISMTESTVCVYDFVIGTPLLCDNPEYPVVQLPPDASATSSYRNDGGGGGGGGNDKGGDSIDLAPSDGSEDWLLSMSVLANGRVMCDVQTQEYSAGGSQLRFSTFELLIESEAAVGGAAAAPSSSPATCSRPENDAAPHVCRHAGRVNVDRDELEVQVGHIRSTAKFSGNLAYAKTFST
jgi:hypothetical protein